MSVEQRLMTLESNQKQLITMVKKLLTANNSTVGTVKDLQKRVADGEKLDAQQQAALDGLKKIGADISAAETVSEVIPEK